MYYKNYLRSTQGWTTVSKMSYRAMIDRHSTIAHSAYHDLLRSLKSDRAAAIRGSVMREERANGRGLLV